MLYAVENRSAFRTYNVGGWQVLGVGNCHHHITARTKQPPDL